MKLTKSKLQQIIKEEINLILEQITVGDWKIFSNPYATQGQSSHMARHTKGTTESGQPVEIELNKTPEGAWMVMNLGNRPVTYMTGGPMVFDTNDKEGLRDALSHQAGNTYGRVYFEPFGGFDLEQKLLHQYRKPKASMIKGKAGPGVVPRPGDEGVYGDEPMGRMVSTEPARAARRRKEKEKENAYYEPEPNIYGLHKK